MQMQMTKNVSGYFSGSESITLTDNEGISANPPIPAAQPAVLTTRTNNTSGSLTMTNSNHGITTGQRVDLYWAGGQCYGAVVGTVAGTTVPIASVSGGANLPIATTAIQVGISTSVSFAFTGNNLTALAAQLGTGPTQGYFVLNNGSSDVAAFGLANLNELYTWYAGNGITNPVAAATPTLVYLSHNYVTGAVTGQQISVLTH